MRGLKKWLIRWMCQPALARVIYRIYGSRIPYRGMTIDPGGQHVSWHAVPRLFWRLYEKAEIQFVQQHLRSDLDVVELGTSLGVVACQIARRQSAEHRLICVEANPELIPVIADNIGRNAGTRNVEIVNCAIGADDAPVSDFAVGADPLESRLATGTSAGVRRVCAVPVRSLSSLLRERRLSEFALVCDIEGAEALLLRNDLGALDRCQQVIIEMHPALYAGGLAEQTELEDCLVSAGFARRALRGPVRYWERRCPTDCS